MLSPLAHLAPFLFVLPLAATQLPAPAAHPVKRQSAATGMAATALTNIGTYTYTGCYDNQAPGHLSGANSYFNGFGDLSPKDCNALCIQDGTNPGSGGWTHLLVAPDNCACSTAGFQVQDAISDSYCSTPCPGNSTETCGGVDANGAVIAYSSFVFTPAPPAPPPPTWHDIGCYQDLVLPGILRQQVHINLFDNTIEKCQATCHSGNFTFAGLESGILCSCGNARTNNKTAPAGDCKTPCSGNHTETCGGVLFRAHLYEYY